MKTSYSTYPHILVFDAPHDCMCILDHIIAALRIRNVYSGSRISDPVSRIPDRNFSIPDPDPHQRI
jgi:hypothetical protein